MTTTSCVHDLYTELAILNKLMHGSVFSITTYIGLMSLEVPLACPATL